MKAKTITRLTVCAAVLIFGASYAPSVHALPDYRVDDWYYTGCGSNLTLVGHTIYWCSGGHSTGGQTTGDWLQETYMKCNPDAPDIPSANFEWCNGAWEERTTLGDCQCSH